jgi:ABC-type transport system substrate-binding protein
MSTKNPTLLWQIASQGSPYGYFMTTLSQSTYVPSGADAENTGNWSHFFDPGATAIVNKWRTSLNVAAQKQLFQQAATMFLKDQPIIPLFIGPRWSTYSTKYFHCFTTPKNYFADPIFTQAPDNVLNFTRICPGGQAGA